MIVTTLVRNTICGGGLILSLILSPFAGFSQNSSLKTRQYFIALSPFALVDYADGSSARLTVERYISPRFSVSTEAGFYTSAGNFFAYKTDPRGFILKPCVKYNFNDVESFHGFYIGLEYQYKKQSYSLADSISIAGSPGFYTHYVMKRNSNAVSVKLGNFQTLRNNFTLEWFAGLGVRFSNSTSSLTDAEYQGILSGEKYGNSTGAGYQVRKVGSNTFLNLLLGIKLGFVF